MNKLKQNWPFIAIGLVTLLLAILAVITALRLQTQERVAPTAPESKPEAAEPEPSVVPECQLSFELTAAPNVTPSPTPSTTPIPSPSPTPTSTPTPGVTPTPTPEVTPSPTASPLAGCNETCTSSANCASGYTCTSGRCRNPSCSTETDCVCAIAQAAPTPSTTPTIPTSGVAWPTIFMIIGGVALLVIGLAIP